MTTCRALPAERGADRPDLNGDGHADLVVVATANTGSGMTEVHALDGATGFTTWIEHAKTAFSYLQPTDVPLM